MSCAQCAEYRVEIPPRVWGEENRGGGVVESLVSCRFHIYDIYTTSQYYFTNRDDIVNLDDADLSEAWIISLLWLARDTSYKHKTNSTQATSIDVPDSILNLAKVSLFQSWTTSLMTVMSESSSLSIPWTTSTVHHPPTQFGSRSKGMQHTTSVDKMSHCWSPLDRRRTQHFLHVDYLLAWLAECDPATFLNFVDLLPVGERDRCNTLK